MKFEEDMALSQKAFKRALCDEKGRRGSVPVVNKVVADNPAGTAMSSSLEPAYDPLEMKIGEVSSAVSARSRRKQQQWENQYPTTAAMPPKTYE